MSVDTVVAMIGAFVALAGVIGSLLGWLIRGLMEVKRLEDKYARREDLDRMEARLLTAINDVSFHLDRHIENSIALWTQHGKIE